MKLTLQSRNPDNGFHQYAFGFTGSAGEVEREADIFKRAAVCLCHPSALYSGHGANSYFLSICRYPGQRPLTLT